MAYTVLEEEKTIGEGQFKMKRISVRFVIEHNKQDIDVEVTASEKDEQVCALLDRVSEPMAGVLPVYDSGNSMVMIPEMSIISISTNNRRLDVITEDGTYELRMPLYSAEKILHPGVFMRISRYEIINLTKVKRFDFSVSGFLKIEMKNGMTTWASRRFISGIRKRLKEKE